MKGKEAANPLAGPSRTETFDFSAIRGVVLNGQGMVSWVG